FMSHMSCCGGPPHKKMKMHESADPRRATDDDCARASRSVGSVRPPAPSWPRRIIASRRWSMLLASPRTAVRGRSPSVVEQKLRAVQQRPSQVFGSGTAIVRMLPQVLYTHVALVRGREAREEGQVEFLDQLRVVLLRTDQLRDCAGLVR